MDGYLNSFDSKVLKNYDQELLMELLLREKLNQFDNHLNVSYEFDCKFSGRRDRAIMIDQLF